MTLRLDFIALKTGRFTGTHALPSLTYINPVAFTSTSTADQCFHAANLFADETRLG
jgi:hypothetical protein